MSTNKDIKNFDALENNSFPKADNSDSEILKSISALDNIMIEQNIEEVSTNFADKLILEVLNSTPAKTKIFKLLSFVFIPIILVCVAIIYFNGGTIESPVLVTDTLEKFNSLLQFTSNPKVQQLFLICEGIILLVIIEKVTSSYRMYKQPSHTEYFL